MLNNIFHSTFDFFSYAVPGTVIVIGIFFFSSNIDSAENFFQFINQFELASYIAFVLIGYVIGFAIHPLGRSLYKALGFRLWKSEIHHDIDLYISEKYSLIREFSPINFKYVETWNMYCAMSHNMAVAVLLIMLLSIVKIVFFGPVNIILWISVMAALVLLFLLFLHRAVVFYFWAANDINATIKSLNLQEKMGSE